MEFNQKLNILIGENNSGKTTILDALRICLSYGNQRRDLWIRKDDFYKNESEETKEIEFHLVFIPSCEDEIAIFREMLSIKGEIYELQIHYKYFLRDDGKIKFRVFGGDNEGQVVIPEVLELLNFVYLGALRDAVNSMKPMRGNLIGQLFTKIENNPDNQDRLARIIKKSLTDHDEWSKLLSKGNENVNEHLKNTSITGKEQKIDIQFFDYDFNSIVDYLNLRLPINESISFNLWQNGLGYNNLIYTATILGDIKSQKLIEPEAYIALLIEEPEAHLHPQLQNIFFEYLCNINDSGFQTFITSHSPTITAKADIDNLIILNNNNSNIHTFSIRNSALTETNKSYLRKFLDVTKSQLFFSNGVIFVEGISEAMLLPVFAKMLDPTNPNKYDLTKNGIEIVIVNGVSFKHFAPLFKGINSESLLNINCAIVSDDDRNESGVISDTAKILKTYNSEKLKVKLANITFEYELFIHGNNKDILFELFSEIHPILSKNYEQYFNEKNKLAKLILEDLERNKTKSEFSHCLADRLKNDKGIWNDFTIPDYIKDAIRWVIGS